MISLFASLAIYVILTRTLGPEDFGLYSTLLVIPLISVGFVQMGIRRSALFQIGEKKYSISKIASAVYLLLIFASLAGVTLSWISFKLYHNPDFESLFVYLILAVIPFKLAIVYFGGILLGAEDIRNANILNWTPLVLNVIIVLLFTVIIPLGITGAVIGYTLSNAIIATFYAILLGKRYSVTLDFDKTVLRELLLKGSVFALSFVVIQMNLRVDMLILNRIGSAAETGYYGLAAQITEQLWLLPSAIGIVVMSRTANTDNSAQITITTARLLRLTLVVGLFVSILVGVLSSFVVPLFFGQEFMGSVSLIIWLLPGILFFMAFRVLNGQLSGMGKPGISAVIFSFALVLNVILNFVLIPDYGAKGAAWATNISYFVGSVGIVLAYSRITGITVKTLFSYSRADFMSVSQWIKRFRSKYYD